MPSNKPVIAVRTDKVTLEKFKIVVKARKRSMSNELEYQIERLIKEYEQENGEIHIEE